VNFEWKNQILFVRPSHVRIQKLFVGLAFSGFWEKPCLRASRMNPNLPGSLSNYKEATHIHHMYYTITLASPTVEPKKKRPTRYLLQSINSDSCKIFLVRQFAIRSINIALNVPCNVHSKVHLPRSPIHSFVSDQMPNIWYIYCNDYISLDCSTIRDQKQRSHKIIYHRVKSNFSLLFA